MSIDLDHESAKFIEALYNNFPIRQKYFITGVFRKIILAELNASAQPIHVI